jgi:hypothetical protein
MCIPSNKTYPMNNYRDSKTSKALDEVKSRRKRRVRFSSDIITGPSTEYENNISKNSNELNAESWYTSSELGTIKRSAKEQAQKYHILSSKAVSSTATMSSLVLPFRNCGVYKKMKYLVKVQSMLNDDDSDGDSCRSSKKKSPEFRGLENRIFVERQRNKTIATNTIMEYQRRAQILVDEAIENQRSKAEIVEMKEQFASRLSTICSQLSQWAKDDALAIARFDAEGVYGVPDNYNEDNENAMATFVKQSKGYARNIKSSSSKRKFPSFSNTDQAMWIEQSHQGHKRQRLPLENICVSS